MKYFYIKKKYTHRILQTNITREYIINLYKNIYNYFHNDNPPVFKFSC